eukprot:NODE_914_length_1992_cov_111.531835_g866_i0.p1 GENE.NODE_914_length_1992_cov_111.531835_g866_i0~~NODE_914_length_1992_cov_111.531835_g866_i0.p1  ORF type:complete len:237 (+),score=26.48 NODE_914_length_1992_cov_111.531835_g866_i0:63-773(+)
MITSSMSYSPAAGDVTMHSAFASSAALSLMLPSPTTDVNGDGSTEALSSLPFSSSAISGYAGGSTEFYSFPRSNRTSVNLSSPLYLPSPLYLCNFKQFSFPSFTEDDNDHCRDTKQHREHREARDRRWARQKMLLLSTACAVEKADAEERMRRRHQHRLPPDLRSRKYATILARVEAAEKLLLKCFPGSPYRVDNAQGIFKKMIKDMKKLVAEKRRILAKLGDGPIDESLFSTITC